MFSLSLIQKLKLCESRYSAMMVCLKQESTHASHFTLLLDKDLKVLVDNGDSQQNTCSRTNCTYNDIKNSFISVGVHLGNLQDKPSV